MKTGYYRTPSILGDRVVFSCANDLWEVSARGGVAHRVNSDPGDKTRPALSPDGHWLSFTSNSSGPPEIYLAASDGKDARRFTFLGSVSRNLGWHREELLFASHARLAFQSPFWLYAASRLQPEPQRFEWGPGSSVAFHASGACVLGRYELTEYSSRKRYRGGARGELWVDREGHGEFLPLLKLGGGLSRPFWIQDRIFFLSDHEGCGNIYSCTVDGKELLCHSNHRSFYARQMYSDGESLIYSHGADLVHFNPQTGPPRVLPIQLNGYPIKGRPKTVKTVSFASQIESYDYLSSANAVAWIARGRAFVAEPESDPREIPAATSDRLKYLHWRVDGKSLLAVISDGLTEDLVILSENGIENQIALSPDFGRITTLIASTSGKVAAITNDRHEVAIVELATGIWRRIDRSDFAEITDLSWSADGKWLAYAIHISADCSVIRVCHIPTGKVEDASAPGFRDHSPSFDTGQAILYFLSERFFAPASTGIGFGLHVTSRPCATWFGSSVPNRVSVLPIAEGKYHALGACRGKLYYTCSSRDPRATENSLTLYAYDLKNKTESQIASEVSDFSLGVDHICYRSRGEFYLLSVQNSSVEPRAFRPIKATTFEVDEGMEWPQMFDEAWSAQKNQFWHPEMNGVPWAEIRDRYRPLLARVQTRSEYSDVLLETFGELQTSHAYEGFIDREWRPRENQGFLGADLKYNERLKAYSIEHILTDELWDRDVSSPLAEPELGIQEGATLLAIDGEPLKPDSALGAALKQKAGAPIRLRLGDHEGRHGYDLTVTPLKSEMALRYRDWVKRSQATVLHASSGRCGYIHLPHTRASGFADFYQRYFSQIRFPALILDARFSSGGSTAEFILDRLSRHKLGAVKSRWSPSDCSDSFPRACPPPILILLINEYTGSDSEVLAHSFRLLKLGPLVGKRTWGGVFGYKKRLRTRDGGFTTQPQTAFWLNEVAGGIENHGVEPDLVVENRPQDYADGQDAQLNRALQEVMRLQGGEPA